MGEGRDSYFFDSKFIFANTKAVKQKLQESQTVQSGPIPKNSASKAGFGDKRPVSARAVGKTIQS